MKTINKYIFSLLLVSILGIGCKKAIDVKNENAPDSDIVLSAPESYPAILSGAYNSFWNTAVAASPTFALTNAEVITSGYASWSSYDFYKVPRTIVPNSFVDDVVLSVPAAAWFGYYSGIPPTNKIIKAITVENKKVIIGGTDYTQDILAHAYLIRGILYGHLGLLYDKAYYVDENTDFGTYDFTKFNTYSEIINFAIGDIDKAITICNGNTFTDPAEMLPGITFDNTSLKAFANSMAARILAESPRTPALAGQVDWNKVYQYASNGMTSDWGIQYKEGWDGKVISRDYLSFNDLYTWDWIRVHQRVINMMAPNDPHAEYPWPEGVSTLGAVTSPDARLNTYFEYAGRKGWNPITRGYNMLSEYKYIRYQDVSNNQSGFFPHFLKAENDLIKAEAGIRLHKTGAEIASLINNTRVTKGNLPALTGGESDETLMSAVFYERYLECDFVFPHLGYFDRRKRGELRPGTLFHFPVPANELILHQIPFYSYGGVGNEM